MSKGPPVSKGGGDSAAIVESRLALLSGPDYPRGAPGGAGAVTPPEGL